MNIYRRISFFDCLMVEIVCGLSNLCGHTHFRADFRGANPPRIHVRISDKRQRSRGIKVQSSRRERVTRVGLFRSDSVVDSTMILMLLGYT
jgi:hypothetical protein